MSSFTSATTPTSTAIDSTNRGVSVPGVFHKACEDLRTYRLRHTLYKTDPDLQAAHEKFPFVVIWDDHEVANDYSGLAPEFAAPVSGVHGQTGGSVSGLLRAHADPAVGSVEPAGRTADLTARLRYGPLAEFTMLDDRQYRSDNPCGDGESLRCEAALHWQLHACSASNRNSGSARALRHRRHSGTSSRSSC